MKNFRWLSIAVLLTGNLVLAGGVSGGGGKTVVKRDKDGRLISVQLLDLWEAENIYERKTKYSEVPVAEQVEAGLQNIKYVLRHPFPNGGLWTLEESEEATEIILENLQKITEMFLATNDKGIKRFRNVTLTPSQDAFEQAKPKNGDLEQMINRLERGPHLFHLDEDLWDTMNNTNKAAAILHEALYYVLWDQFGETNSIRVRRAVGLAMSGYKFQPFVKFIPKRHVECVSELGIPLFSRVFAVEVKEGLNFIFDMVGGVPALGYTDPNNFPEVLGVNSLEEFFTPGPPTEYRAMSIGALDGPIDYRISNYSFISHTNEKGELEHYLEIKDSVPYALTPPKAVSDLKLKLNCTFRK